MANQLLWPTDAQSTRILYLARYAPDDPVYSVKPEPIVSGYSEYHFNIFRDLRDIGYAVHSSSKPYAVMMSGGQVDFVFSLLNRMPFRHPELFIPSMCEYLHLPMLGAPPNIRALAEDKLLSKLAFQALGIPTPRGRAYDRGEAVLEPPPFAGPYFVKDRFGAASEGVTADNLQDIWADTLPVIRRLQAEGRQVLVEEYAPGIDVTVPVLGHAPYQILGHVAPCSDKPGHILTEDLKCDDHLGNVLVDVGDTAVAMADDINRLWRTAGPIDYFRLDYRWDPATGRRLALEFNICCYLGEGGALCLAGAEHGYSRKQILAHVVEYSRRRQQGSRDHCAWMI